MFSISTETVPARLAGTPDDYARLGIAPREIKPWEDGIRTKGARGTYEWWYFDAHLDDGAKLVVVFSTREFSDLNQPLSPGIRIDLTLPDGTPVRKLVQLPADTFSAQPRPPTSGSEITCSRATCTPTPSVPVWKRSRSTSS